MRKKEQEIFMKELVLNILAALCALFLLTTVVTAPFWVSSTVMKMKEVNNIKETVDSLKTVIANMQQVDTLILDMSEYNSRNIEVLTENNETLASSVKTIQRKVRDIDYDLDRFD